MSRSLLFFILLFQIRFLLAQKEPGPAIHPAVKQIDLVDIDENIFNKKPGPHRDTVFNTKQRVRINVFSAAGYTLQTGLAVAIGANATFYTKAIPKSSDNISTIVTALVYTGKNQIIFPIAADIWTRGNKYNIISDSRYLKYPSVTYGLGGYTQMDSVDNLDYSYIKLHQAILKKVTKDFYMGFGYDFEYFWNIRETDPGTNSETAFEKYGLNKTEKVSGISLNFKYDSRRTEINPQGGILANLIFQPKFT